MRNQSRHSLGIFILLLFILSFQFDGFSQEKKYQGLLWEITKKGEESPSYLYGTMHVASKVAFHLTDSFYVAIKGVDVVGLETNPAFWLRDMLKSGLHHFSLTRGFGLQTRGFYKNGYELTEIDNRILSYFLSYDSQFSNNLLYRKSQGYQENFQEDTYLDMFIFQAGKKLGKEVTNLEDFNESQDLVTESFIAERKSLDNNVQKSYDFGDKRPGEIIQDAYRVGDLDLLDSIGRITGTEEGRALMLYKRNENIAISIDSIIHAGRSVFAAVGAAHLPGNEGVIEKLRTMGYTVRAVTKAEKSTGDEKDKIDEMIYPLEMKTTYPGDSSFSASLPSSIIPPPRNLEFTEYIVPDMPNGANYFIRAINTFAPLMNQDQEFIYERIDSLLFENIPGKIVEINKEEKDEYGHPVIWIKNETKQGNFQQYKIIVTPFELYIFKVIGIKEYATKEYANQFIETAKLNYTYDKDWRAVTPYFKGFEISMPGNVKIEDARDYTSMDKNALIQGYDQPSKSYFFCSQLTVTDAYFIEEDTFELRYIVDNFCDELKFKTKISEKVETINGYPSYFKKVKNDNGEILYCRSILRGPNYYLLVTKTPKKKIAEKFLYSFKFIDFETHSAHQEIVDSTLLFSVKTYCNNPKSKYDELMELTKYKDDKEDTDYKNQKEYQSYFVYETGEEIKLIYGKFHDYDYEELDEAYNADNYMYDFIEFNPDFNDEDFDYEEYANDKDYLEAKALNYKIVTNDFIDTSNRTYQWKEYEVRRDHSTRGIYGRYIVYKDRFYNIRVLSDTLTGPSEYALDFMNNFTPMDTLIGYDITIPKDSMFFAHIMGSDSLLQMRAFESIDEIEFTDENADQLIELIETTNFSEFENGFAYRVDLLQKSGRIKDDKILAFLEKKYIEAEDTSALQIAILKAITTEETVKNHELFIKLLLQETPLTSKSKIKGLFYYLEDSIELNKLLFPRLYELSAVPEYTDNVYKILAALLDEGHIDKSFYADKIDYLYRETKMEIKRYSNELIEDRESEYNYNSSMFSYNYLGNQKLSNLLRMLMPFYDEDERVKKIFEKMQSIENIQSLAFTAKLMHEYDRKIADSIWSNFYENNRKYAFPIAMVLRETDNEKFIEQMGITADSIATSIFLFKTDLALEKNDSLKLIRTIESDYKGEKLLVYVYKYQKESKYSKGATAWKLGIVGILPENKTSPYFSELVEYGIQIKENKSLEETIHEELKAIRFIHRDRVQKNGNYDFYEGY